MSIFDKTARSGSRNRNSGADPAHAFGSQEQIMAEFQRQSYVPPENASRRSAGSVLSSLRDRIARPQRQYETDAPVYSAETYDQPAAPDLGWNAAFDPDARQAEQTAPGPSAQERYEAFRSTVYSSPYPRQAFGSYRRDGSPLFEELSFTAPPRRESTNRQPVYEEIRFGGPAPEPQKYEKPVYEELDLFGRSAARPDSPGSAPPAEEVGHDPAHAAGPQFAAQQEPPASPAMQQTALASDFQYFFWSMSILTGAVLTLFSFVYACIV